MDGKTALEGVCLVSDRLLFAGEKCLVWRAAERGKSGLIFGLSISYLSGTLVYTINICMPKASVEKEAKMIPPGGKANISNGIILEM